MKNVTVNDCDCPNDCNSIGYYTTVSSLSLNEKIYCPKDAGLFKDFQGPLGLPKMFFSYYNLIVNKVTLIFYFYTSSLEGQFWDLEGKICLKQN